MKFRYEIESRQGYLLMRCMGRWQPEPSRECWIQLAHEMRRLGCERALVDDREIRLETNTNTDFRHAEFVAETLGSLCRRLALVDRGDNDQPNRFFETVCVNRGLRLKFFTEMAPATEWLLE